MSSIDPVRSVFVAMPSYGGIEPGFVTSLLDLQLTFVRLGIQHDFVFLPGESLITRARNRLVRQFLDESDRTHLLFLDCDLVFHPSTVLRMLASGHEVCAAPYAKKAIGQGLVANIEPKPGTVHDRDGQTVCEPQISGGWVKVKDAGTGCMLVARTAFEKIRSAKRPDGEPFMCPYTDDMGTPHKTWPFFDSGVEDGRDPESRLLSEDFWFCRLWQKLGGGDVWCDTASSIKHVGKYVYSAPSFQRQWEAK